MKKVFILIFTMCLMALTMSAQKTNGPKVKYVDLGLSVKWATCNLGATKPEEYGNYYAWGEIRPKTNYSLTTYKWYNEQKKELTKYRMIDYDDWYDVNIYDEDVLDLEDDAARANWGGTWRMPTYREWLELRNNCTWTWTTQNGIKGYKVTSRNNGNSIFLPAAGYWVNSNLTKAGSNGYYWSSFLSNDFQFRARGMWFDSSDVSSFDFERSYGVSVRPVSE